MTVSLASMKAHLNITDDTNDAMIGEKIAVAQAMVEQHVGEVFADMDDVPAPLLEAVRMTAAHLFHMREGIHDSFTPRAVPAEAMNLIRPFKRWVF